MKIKNTSARQGSGLIVAIILIAIIGISIASYLSLVRTQNLSVMRSLYWNSALPVAESGLEEAMAHLSVNKTNLSQQGWSLVNGNYQLARTNGDQTYTVTITTNGLSPTVTSTGRMNLAAMQRPDVWVKRVVRITTTNAALFAKSLVAKNQIDLKGNNAYSDSFDSEFTNASTGGLYDPAKRRDNGDVATNAGLTNSLNIGSVDIYGKISTGPGGSVSIGPNGVVGTLAYINGGGTGIQSGRISDDMNVALPDVLAPFATAAAPPSGSGDTLYVLDNGNFQLTSLSMSGQKVIEVTGNAVLYVTGDLSMSGLTKINIATNASLKIYVGGKADYTGQGVVNNTGLAINCQLYGLPTCTSFKLAGLGGFTGVVYAPSASFTGVGNGELFGSVVCKDATLTGNMNFHYDESLSRIGPRSGYVPTTWAEL